MIQNGKDLPLGLASSGLPDVSGAVDMLLQPVSIGVVQKRQVDGYTQEVTTYFDTKACRQPFSPRKLEVLPEGERSWRWETLWTLPNLVLKPDDVIYYRGIRYRVMSRLNWSEYGFYEFNILEDYVPT